MKCEHLSPKMKLIVTWMHITFNILLKWMKVLTGWKVPFPELAMVCIIWVTLLLIRIYKDPRYFERAPHTCNDNDCDIWQLRLTDTQKCSMDSNHRDQILFSFVIGQGKEISWISWIGIKDQLLLGGAGTGKGK